YWETEHTEGRRPDLGVFIGDEYMTITFRRAREHLDAFDIEVWHPDFDNPNFDRFRWRRQICEDVREEPAAAAAASEPLSSSPSSEEAEYTMRGVPRSSSTSRHDNGVERLMVPKSQPHLNGHRQRLPQQIAANKDPFGSGSDDKDDNDDNSHEQFIDTGDNQTLTYRRRTTAETSVFRDAQQQLRQQQQQ
ncbi:imidazoleglycerol-phosphate dehydratase, partial [Ascosphaera pollenicola]